MSSVTDGAAHYLFSKFIITESMKMLSLSIRQKIESYLRTKCEACHIAVMCSQGMNPKCKFNLVKDVIISVLDIGWSKEKTSERTCTIYSMLCPTLGLTF